MDCAARGLILEPRQLARATLRERLLDVLTARRRARTTFGWPMSPTRVLISREESPARCAVDDRGVAKKARYIVACACSLVFLFSLDEALAHVVHFRRRLLLAHYVR